ncbi:MAG TPA: cysteine desulfurase [Candidatus Faecimonas intestinavium]|nr:cysteine desulfurase [Candidatus Faecimonas intestinavium]
MIYLDYSATTPVNEEVLNSYIETTKKMVGNPNSLHKLGIEAKSLIDAATRQIANILKVKPNEIIYTSGASESNNTAIKGICLKYQNRGKHIITTHLEHSSIIEPLNYLKRQGFEVEYVNITENGMVDIEDLKKKIRDDTILVTIASINSEVGIVQPIKDIAALLKKYPKVYFHSDITQSLGKEKVDLTDIDLASFSAQKFYGMKGIGGLVKKENVVIEPLIHGGKSTTKDRSGTPATALIVSMAKALRLAYENLEEKQKYVKELNIFLRNELEKNEITINSPEVAIPNILNISLENIKPETVLHALEEKEIYISTKTACATNDSSDAVYAITKDEEKAKHSLRISLSYLTTKKELEIFITELVRIRSELSSLYAKKD